MNKFIGQMSYEDFKEALKIILSKDANDDESQEKLSLIDKIKAGFQEIVDTIKYIFSPQPFKDLWQLLLDCINFIKYIVTFKFIDDIKAFVKKLTNKEEKQPLTKEEFIRKGKKVKAFIWETVDTVVFVVVMVIIIRFFIGEIRWIPSGSMHPTLYEGDRIFVERYSRFYKTPNRGDIMVFYPPFETLKNTPIKVFARLTGFFCKDVAYIKRVIGMPGEKFEIKTAEDGRYTVYINDKPLNEPYIQSEYDYRPCVENMVCGPIVIPEGYYMMLGDNRGNSQDGRYWGLLPKDRFIGRAVYLFWPFRRAKSLTK